LIRVKEELTVSLKIIKSSKETIMSRAVPTTMLSFWHHGADGLQYSSNDFYSEVERALAAHHVSDIKTERVQLLEGGMFSAKREYLQVRRKEHVFLICAATFGNIFFISWYLGHIDSGIGASLSRVPVIGFFVRNVVKRMTYYKLDTAIMFQTLTHETVAGTLNAILNAKGKRALSDTERAPVMRDFFAQIAGA
jgi:hypothetical protein